MLLEKLKEEYLNSLLEFLWRQWSQLGVYGEVRFKDRWLIDPEALLVFTLNAGRYDPRLFDEVLDWCVCNSRWISVQRLRNLAEHMLSGTERNILISVAGIINSYEHGVRWRALADMTPEPFEEPLTLFWDHHGKPLPLIKESDPVFLKLGVVRPPIELRKMSQSVPMEAPTNLFMRMRSLFGLGTRPDILTYLLTHDWSNASSIARSTFYSIPPVQDVLSDLVQSGLIETRQPIRDKLYQVDTSRWRAFLSLRDLPTWIEWPRVMEGLTELLHFLTDKRLGKLSEYMMQSRLLTLTEKLHNSFSDSGIPTKFPSKPDLEDSAKYFEPRVRTLMRTLNRPR